MWDDVESLEIINDNLQISVPYKKLSKLHPADLADILEEMDSEHRTKVLENLDETLDRYFRRNRTKYSGRYNTKYE